MTKTISIDGFRLSITGTGTNRSVTLSQRADRACGLHRKDFAECSAREVQRYESIKRECAEYAEANGVAVTIYTSYGAACDTV